MKKRDIRSLLSALKNITITTMQKDDQFAIIDNIIALTDESEKQNKIEEQAYKEIVPEDYDSLDRAQKLEMNGILTKKLNDFMLPKYDIESEIEIKSVSSESIDKILKQKEEISTGEKAIAIKFLKDHQN